MLQGGTLTTDGSIDGKLAVALQMDFRHGEYYERCNLESCQRIKSNFRFFGSSLNLGFGRTLNITGNETIGGGPFTFTLSGGTHTVSGDITLKAGGTFSETTSPLLTYTNFNQMGGTLTGVYQQIKLLVSRRHDHRSVHEQRHGNVCIQRLFGGSVQNNGTMTVNSGQLVRAAQITNSGSFVLAGGSIQETFTNAAGATLTAHGSIIGPLANHGTLILDGVFVPHNSNITNDGTIQGAGIINTAAPINE